MWNKIKHEIKNNYDTPPSTPRHPIPPPLLPYYTPPLYSLTPSTPPPPSTPRHPLYSPYQSLTLYEQNEWICIRLFCNIINYKMVYDGTHHRVVLTRRCLWPNAGLILAQCRADVGAPTGVFLSVVAATAPWWIIHANTHSSRLSSGSITFRTSVESEFLFPISVIEFLLILSILNVLFSS